MLADCGPQWYLVCKLGHVVLQPALVVGLLTHLDQDVEVAVLLGQSRHPLVLAQVHCKTQRPGHGSDSVQTPSLSRRGQVKP